MSAANYSAVMDVVLKHEGGFTANPRDPGNWTGGKVGKGELRGTNMGIAAHAHPGEDIRGMTRARALEIYRAGYWAPIRGDDLPDGLDLVGMDGAVNSGVSRGAKWLQSAVGAAADGRVGPDTITRAHAAPVSAIARACDLRMGFLRALSHWDAFGRGWANRVADVQAVATRMWLAAAGRDVTTGLRDHADAAEAAAPREEKAGQAQAGGAATTGAAGGVGADAADLPVEVIVAIAIITAALAVLVIVRARRRAAYKRTLARRLREEADNA